MKMAFRSLILLLTIVQAESAISNSSPIFGPKQVTGLVGGSVTVKCFYPRTSVNRHSRKYWCKESTQHCSTIISSNGYVARGFEGRTSIIDYPENGLFTIEISNLVRRDMGPYKCGVGLNDKGLSFRVKLDVSAGSILPEEAQLFYAEQHGSVTITCAFGARASGRNYLCKMTKYTCVTIIDTDGNIDQFYKGRVLLSNLQIPGSFNIIMTQLQKQDSGLYLCGTGNYGAEGETKKLDIHVYEEVLVSKQQPILNGVQGGSVSVECHYEPKENTTIKSWCKWKENECTVLINNLGDVRDDYEGRIVMHNSPENGTYTIILNQLHNGDEGFYWCMTSGEQERISSTELKIVQETGQPSLSVDNEIHAVAGSPLTITCTYPCKYADYEKYWCKWKNTGCEPLIASEESQAGLVVSCDKGSRILSLNFDQTSLSDQGWYWCGVRKGGHYGETYATYLQVQGVLRNAEEPSRPNEEPSDVVSQNRNIPLNNANKKVNDDIPADSHKESKHSTILLSVLLPLGIILVLLATAFFVVKFRLFKHSDLVSVGSYRTHISMTDFENARQYGAKDNVCMAEAHETQIGDKDDYNITTSSPKEAGKSKKAKRNSKEDVEMVYTTFLLNSENIPPRGSQQQ
ncbi:polymeric immunoglobulin receptor [Anolis carolinensis]|uniref:polymeric immunoglobulin receptor n=1 Tax=Anolis carolinensis TaxID=28377 RepID=UPI002F2B1C68